MTDYLFCGEVIKLTAKDYYKWQNMYKNLNLTEELEQMDMEFEARRDSGEKIKNWFVECIKRLNGRNKRAARYTQASHIGPRTTRDMTIQQESDRSWATTGIDLTRNH